MKNAISVLCSFALITTAIGSAVASEHAAELSLEQLLNAEVSGVSKAQERLLDAPASVTVITADEIRAFGFRSLTDVLNLARGFYTYSDRTYDFIGVRGFAPIGDYNTRVLLLIDGMPANDNYYEQAAVGTEAIIDLELIERVEVIRGPSSSIYGTNAFLGVINVITKGTARAENSAQVGLGSGRERTLAAGVAGGGGSSLRYMLRVSRQVNDGEEVDLGVRPGFPQGQKAGGVDGMRRTRVFARITAGLMDVEVGHSIRTKHAGYGLYGSDIGDPRVLAREGQTFGNLRYTTALGDATDLALRLSRAAYDYKDVYVFAGDPIRGRIDGDWAGTEATLTHRISSAHRLVAGIELRRDFRMDTFSASDAFGLLQDTRVSANRKAIYAQDDFEWSKNWSTSLGVRYDRQASIEEVSPRGAVLFKPTRSSTFKLMLGRAFRAPNSYEKFYEIPEYNIANPALKAERIRTIDAEYEGQISDSTRIAATLFRYRASKLVVALVDPDSGLTQYVNEAEAEARGLDALLESDITQSLRLRFNGSYARALDAERARLQNSPRFTGRAGVLWRVVPEWRIAAEAVHVGRRTAGFGALPSHTVVNLTLSSKPRRGVPELSLSAYNLLDRLYAQPWESGGLLADTGVGQLRRNWRVTVGYAF